MDIENHSPAESAFKFKVHAVQCGTETLTQASRSKKSEFGKQYDVVKEFYELKNVIGQGSYGKVVLATCKTTGRTVAIKFIEDVSENEYNCVKAIREIQILRHLNNKSKFSLELIDMYASTYEKKLNLFIVMEHFGTDLKSVLSQSSECLTEQHISLILYNTLCALKYLHSSNVIHRDIKTSNILVDENCQVKICDFGLSRTLPDSCIGKASGNTKRLRDSILKSQLSKNFEEKEIKVVISKKLTGQRETREAKKRSLSNHIGTRWYRAPEVIAVEKQYDTAIDMWSMGCILHEMLFTAGKEVKVLDRILCPGNSCFPLSPCEKKRDGRSNFVSSQDQLKLILKRVGPLSESDLSFMTDDSAISYVKDMAKKIKERDLPSDSELEKLQNWMLEFNPYFRCSSSEAIKSKLFDKFREPKNEKSAQDKIFLPVDQDAAFNYDTGKSEIYQMDSYKQIIHNETLEIHKKWLKKYRE